MRRGRRLFVLGVLSVVAAGAFVDSLWSAPLVMIGLACLAASVFVGLRGAIYGR